MSEGGRIFDRRMRGHTLLFALLLLCVNRDVSAQLRPNPLPVGPVVLEGELEVIYEDDDVRGRLLHFLNVDGRRIPVRFLNGLVPDLPTGARVRVSGDQANGSVTTTTTGVTVLATSTSRTIGLQNVLVIRFNFSNNPLSQPFSDTAIATVNSQVTSYYVENTFGQTTLAFSVTPWYTIDAPSTPCDYTTWGSLADTKATNNGYSLKSYDRIVYAFPSTSGCSWSGMGNVSGPRSWINGSYSLRTVAHEQGHNFGDHHSKANNCTSSGCTVVEYGDDRDIMGYPSVTGHMNAFQKERLGWLNYSGAPMVQQVTATGNYWIDAYENVPGATKGIKVYNPLSGGYYYAEIRTKIGFDGTVSSGVTLHHAYNSISYQVDLAPTASTFDSTLDVGQSFTDAAIGLTIQTLSVDSAGASLAVTLTPPPCNARAPIVSLTTVNAFKYTLTIKNADDTLCSASPFSLKASIPAGWTATFSPASISSLAPGASVSATLTLAVATVVSGTYPVAVTVANTTSGLSSTVNASVTLATTLTVTATAALTGSGNARSAAITLKTLAGGTPAIGAAIKVVVTNPKGSSTTLNATADATGTATVKYAVKASAPSGVYQVLATATGNGGTGTATTTFVVP